MVDKCDAIIQVPNNGTTWAKYHLKMKHGIEDNVETIAAAHVTVRNEEVVIPNKITRYLTETDRETYAAYMARLCVNAEISFHKLTSFKFKEIFIANGFDQGIVSSPNTFRTYILGYAEQICLQSAD